MIDVKKTLSKIINWISNRGYAYTGYGVSQGITNYTSSSNAFTVPKDGMLRLQTRYTQTNYIGVTIANSDLSNQIQFQVGGNGSANQNWAIPVFKGQKVWRHSNNGQYNYIDYIPFVGG